VFYGSYVRLFYQLLLHPMPLPLPLPVSLSGRPFPVLSVLPGV